MNRFRNFRILPLVLAATIALVGLKIMGLVLEGGYIFNDRTTARERVQDRPQSWAQEMLNFPGGKSRLDMADVTGSTPAPKKEEKKPDAPQEKIVDQSMPADPTAKPVSASERAILERLQDRRQELEARAREIDIRENLLRAAEKRIEAKVEEMKAVEARIGSATEQKAQADAGRFKGIVTMYESMKPKDAAKIFDRLDMAVLIEVALQIAPRKMSDILGQMQPEAAERLTVEMARRASGDKTAATDLPKIEGKAAAAGN
jgi:flagellar motility protein MotE (MotC chaperone)